MSSHLIQPVQGMSDIAPPEISLWQRLEQIGREILARYGFEELRTPIVEFEALFTRSLGETTDVVQKEMYVFEKGGRRLCLRPEGTAGVLRYAAALGEAASVGARWFYFGPMFRSERPQAGRRRQFHQCGVECLEPPAPLVDAEILALQMHLLEAWGLEGLELRLSTRGEADDQGRVTSGLREALIPRQDQLCEDCRRRLQENVLRVLDCKQENCRATVAGLPPATDWMGAPARAYLQEVVARLQDLGIAGQLDPLLVRGLDYYEHTVWEITSTALGAQNAVAGGGRYRVKLGHRELTGVGFAIGLERVIAILQSSGADRRLLAAPAPRLWLVGLGPAAQKQNLVLMQQLRRSGWICQMAPEGSVKSQMRAANKAGAAWVILRGDDELAQGAVTLKNMLTGEQSLIPTEQLCAELNSRTHK